MFKKLLEKDNQPFIPLFFSILGLVFLAYGVKHPCGTNNQIIQFLNEYWFKISETFMFISLGSIFFLNKLEKMSKNLLIFSSIIGILSVFIIKISLTFFNIAKPAIYLYPEKEINASVKLKINGDITKTIPAYKSGWNVTVKPSGAIKNINGNSQITYDYLFYENTLKTLKTSYDAWFVKKENIDEWLSIYLNKLGLNKAESKEFKDYWLPKLKNIKEKYIMIQLLSDKFLNKNMTLIIFPKPDSLLRLEFVFKGTDFIDMRYKTPKIKEFKREGFSVVEWGGTIIDKDLK